MATQQTERQGNPNHAEASADVRLNLESAPQSGGAPGIPENEVDEHHYRPLLRAALQGNWKSAESFFRDYPGSKTAKITNKGERLLHIATLSAQDQFVKKLVKLLRPEELVEADRRGHTALHNAVLCGRIKMVKALVKKNPTLTQIDDKNGLVPFNISAREASMHKEIAWFLAKNTTDDGPSRPFSHPNAMKSILALTYAGHHDIVLYLVGRYSRFTLARGPSNTDNTILGVLARMQYHFLSGTRLSVWEALIYKCIPVDVKYNSTDENSRNMQTSMDPACQCHTRSLWNAAKLVGKLLIAAFRCLTRSPWNVAKFIVPSIKRIHDVKLRHLAAVELAKQVCIVLSEKNTTEIIEFFQHRNLLGQATVNGISELVKLCIQYFPELIWIPAYGTSLMTLAVTYRQERTLRLFLKVSSSSGLAFAPAESTNGLAFAPAPSLVESRSMMLAVTKYDPDFVAADVSGAAFQMQRQLQWFKAVESWVIPDLRTELAHVVTPNTRTATIPAGTLDTRTTVVTDDRKTYWQIFVKNHEKLLESGQKWVKGTADKCMLVSTLIATVLFAAAFTVPGTNNGNKEAPLKGFVLVFAIFDGLGLLSSVTATLLFLAILTSRNEPLDFLDSLPKKIIMGLSSLFLSLVFMLVAFAATLTIVLDKTPEWIVLPIILLTSVPLFSFVVQQLPLLFQMVKSTYGSIFRSEGIWN